MRLKFQRLREFGGALLLSFLFLFPAFGAEPNRVLSLHGAGAFVELPPGVLSSLKEATIEFWARFDDVSEPNKRGFDYGTPERDVSLAVMTGGGCWFVLAENAKTYHQIATRPLIRTNQWNHFAGTLGPAGMRLYLNGWLLGSNSYSGGFERTLPQALFRFGERVTERDPLSTVKGAMDEIRLWDRARSQDEIRAAMHERLRGDEPNLAGLWNFDDGTARDAGPHHWNGEFKGRAGTEAEEVPKEAGAQVFLEAEVRASDGRPAKAVILEAWHGTNVHASFSEDGFFKVVLPATESFDLRFSQINAHLEKKNVEIPVGGQKVMRVDLPARSSTRENTNVFAAGVNRVLQADPASLEHFDMAVLLDLMPLIAESEGRILTLFESPVAERRRFVTQFVEKFERSSVAMISALARARHDKDELVRGLAQNALQTLPIPKEFEALYTKRQLAIAALFAGLLIPFALIHVFLFVLHPAKLSNLYYGVFTAVGALMIYFGAVGGASAAETQIATLAFMTLGLLVLNSLFYARFPWTFWLVVAVAGVALAGLALERREIAAFSTLNWEGRVQSKALPFVPLAAWGGGYVAFFVVVLEMLRVVLLSVWRRKDGAWLIGAGFLMLVLAGIVRIALYGALFTGGISTDTFARYILYFPNVGAAGFVICGSIYLARAFSQIFAEVRTAKIEIEKKNVELTVARDVALTANKAKSQFLANMSHELRTPLNAIIGYSELLAEVVEEDDQKQYLPDLQKITGAAQHQLMLVNDILDLSKIEAGKMALNVEEFGVKEMVNEIRGIAAPLVAKQRNRFEVELPADIGTLRADPMKVRQVLFNLLSNAAKFTEEGVVALKTARTNLNGAPAISFAVQDTGIGMTPEQAGRLFQAFTQAEAGIHQKYGGTGLGLVISKRFCEMMGGTLTARSEFGKGSTFTATIPQTVMDKKDPPLLARQGGGAKLQGAP